MMSSSPVSRLVLLLFLAYAGHLVIVVDAQIVTDEPFIVAACNDNVLVAPLDDLDSFTVLQETSVHVFGVIYVHQEQRIYFNDLSRIMQMDINDGTPEVFVDDSSDGSKTILELAVDIASRQIFYTANLQGKVQLRAVSLDDSDINRNIPIIVDNLGSSSVLVKAGRVYVILSDQTSIQSIDAASGNTASVYTFSAGRVDTIGIDVTGDTLYSVQRSPFIVHSRDLDDLTGTTEQQLVPSDGADIVLFPNDIETNGDWLYFGISRGPQPSSLSRIPKAGGTAADIEYLGDEGAPGGRAWCVGMYIHDPCTNVAAPAGGARSPDMGTISSDSAVTLTCSSGFTLVGDTTSTCTDGALSPDIAGTTCAADCTNVAAPAGGARSPDMGTISSGSAVTLTCSSGFTLVGDTTSTCTDGALSPDIAGTTCVKRFLRKPITASPRRDSYGWFIVDLTFNIDDASAWTRLEIVFPRKVFQLEVVGCEVKVKRSGKKTVFTIKPDSPNKPRPDKDGNRSIVLLGKTWKYIRGVVGRATGYVIYPNPDYVSSD